MALLGALSFLNVALSGILWQHHPKINNSLIISESNGRVFLDFVRRTRFESELSLDLWST